MTWNEKFMQVARVVASWSKDPNKQVGCVVIDDDHNQQCGGYNGFPRGIKDNDRLHNREKKLNIIVHAEGNAVAAAARRIMLGTTIVVTEPVCTRCAGLLIQAGVKHVVFQQGTYPSKWEQDWKEALALFEEAGVTFQEVDRQQHEFHGNH